MTPIPQLENRKLAAFAWTAVLVTAGLYLLAKRLGSSSEPSSAPTTVSVDNDDRDSPSGSLIEPVLAVPGARRSSRPPDHADRVPNAHEKEASAAQTALPDEDLYLPVTPDKQRLEALLRQDRSFENAPAGQKPLAAIGALVIAIGADLDSSSRSERIPKDGGLPKEPDGMRSIFTAGQRYVFHPEEYPEYDAAWAAHNDGSTELPESLRAAIRERIWTSLALLNERIEE